MLDDQRQHKRLVERLRRLHLPGWIGGGVLDWYSLAMRRWAPVQDGSTYFGAAMRCDPGDSIQEKILLFGAWEPGVSRVIEGILGEGDVFVDIGANVGYDSLLAAARVGDSGSVVAIEASPRIHGALEVNLALNPGLARRVRQVNVAVSDQPGQVDLYEFAGNIGGTTTLASRHGTLCATVEAARLGDIHTADERARVRLIKMDVEGLEPTILNDILDHLDDYPANMDIIFEANPEDDPQQFQKLFDRLRDAGFTAWAIENKYSNAWYLRWRETPLQRLTEAPRKMRDVLLTRSR
jgi:FkbM family methyltransferase